MYVIKRNGKRELRDDSKIKKQITFGVKGTSITPLEFENKVRVNFVNDIKTTDLQNILIKTAEKEASAEKPDWIKVAGRVGMWEIYGEVFKRVNFNTDDWINHIKFMVDSGYYKPEVLDKIAAFNVVTSDIDIGVITNHGPDNLDFNCVTSTARSFKSKYIIKDSNNELLEYPFLIYIVNSLLLADTKEEFLRYYGRFARGELSLGTPFLNNLRKPNGNVGSCYIGTNINSLVGLMKSWTDMSIISKEGGGIGWYVGYMSVSGAKHKKVKKANDKVKWHKIVDDIAESVDQAGSRAAAITLADDWWQKDIYSFLDMRLETSGDLRGKCFNIFPQAVIDKYFVEKVEADEDVYLFDHHEFKQITGIVIQTLIDDKLYRALDLANELCRMGKMKNHKKVNAFDLWLKILTAWLEIGGFYITHKDNINISNYLKYDDKDYAVTNCTNLCIESFSIVRPARNWTDVITNGKRTTTHTDGLSHSCNLISINVRELIEKDDEYIAQVCSDAVNMLTRSIRLGTNPTLEGATTAKLLQNIGIGTIGFPDYMAYYRELYDTESGRKLGTKLQEKLTYYSYRASIELAKKEGSYPLFKKENYDRLIGKTTTELNNISKWTGNNYDWEELRQDILTHGIANFYLMATAPNTSTGLLMGVGASYLPVFGKFNYEETKDEIIPVSAVFLNERYWFYKTRYQYDPVDIVTFTKHLQDFIDTGISMEINIDIETTDIFKLSEAFLNGFKEGRLKGVYYNSSAVVCSDCAN